MPSVLPISQQLDVIIGSEVSMIHSQEELDKRWLELKEQPVSDYDSERILDNLPLFQRMQLDVLVTSGSMAGTNGCTRYERRRENPDADWGLWEEGDNARCGV
jgi:hypothetical protein